MAIYPLHSPGSAHAHPPAVEPPEAEAREQLVAGEAQLVEQADGHLLAELEPLDAVRAPVHAAEVPPQGDVGGELVQLPAHSQIRALIGHQLPAVRRRDDWPPKDMG